LPRPAGPPPENQADASRAIQVAYAAAFAANSPQQVSDAVEGGFQLSPADRAQGPGAPTPPGQGETARVTALSFVDQTHAAVNFELLLDNIRISPITPGTAVLVDGTWKVTRTTYCGIIVNLGGAACPA
jgi:hypothetical protein